MPPSKAFAREGAATLPKLGSCDGQTVPAEDASTIQRRQEQMRGHEARRSSCKGKVSSTAAATRVQSRAAQLTISGLPGAAAEAAA